MKYYFKLKERDTTRLDEFNVVLALEEALEVRGFLYFHSRSEASLKENTYRFLDSTDGVVFETNPPLDINELLKIYEDAKRSLFGTSLSKYDFFKIQE